MSDAEFGKAVEEYDPVAIKMPFAWASLPREQREPGGHRSRWIGPRPAPGDLALVAPAA